MSVHEIGIAFSWLLTVLSTDSQLAEIAPGGVWRSIAPDATGTPFVVMSFQSGTDVTTMQGFRVLDEVLCLVKAVAPSSQMAIVQSAASRIDALIGNPPTAGMSTGGYVASSYRQTPFLLDELVAGVLWTSLGGLYRLLIEQME